MPRKKIKNECEKTVQEVFDTLNEEQKKVVYAMVAMASDNNKNWSWDFQYHIKHLNKLAIENRCVIGFCVGPDSCVTISVDGKHHDFTVIGTEFDNAAIESAIIDTIRRANS